MSPLLSVIMVNYFSEADLAKCVVSLCQYDPTLHFELIVVDNGSTGDNLQIVLSQLPLSIDVKVIHNAQNVGFAKACNQGFAQIQGKYILLLNPDTLLVENSISQMVDFLDHHQETGVVGCSQMLPSGRPCVGDAGYYPCLSRAFNHSFFLSRLFPNVFKGMYLIHKTKAATPIEVDWVSGGCLLLKRELLRRAGGMDESFFLYSEDVEWCSRIKRNGWRIYYLPFTYIIHNTRRNPLGDPNPGLWLKSQIGLYRRDHNEVLARLFSLTVLSGMIFRSIVYLFLYFFFRQSEDKAQARYLLRSVFASLQ
jgi:GT2 family glycosyltransferase